MKYSIIIPIYNNEKYLEECVNSILVQINNDCEIILVDDGSTDSSSSICDEYQARYSVVKVIHQENKGSFVARVSGIKNSTGEYVFFCDSDDFWRENLFESVESVIERNNYDIVSFGATLFDDKKEDLFIFDSVDSGLIDKSRVLDEILFDCKLTSMCMKVCRRNLLLPLESIQDMNKHSYGDDTLQSFIAVLNGKSFYYLNESLYYYRMNTGMTSRYSDEFYSDCLAVYKQLSNIIETNKLEEYDLKLKLYLLYRAYDAVRNMAKNDNQNKETLLRISSDKDFLECFDSIVESQYWMRLNKKQRLILKALKKQNLFVLCSFIKAKRVTLNH